MLSLYEILKASKTGIAPDMRTALAGMNWGGAGSGAEVKELTGIPPLSFTADGTPLLDYLISGNLSQTGTPSPDNPIQPQETGERTGNLLPFTDKLFSITAGNSNLTVECKNGNLFFQGNAGEIGSSQAVWKNNFAFELEAGTYYCNSPVPLGQGFGRYIKKYDDNTTILTSTNYTFTLSEKTKCFLSFYIYQKTLDSQVEVMLNSGSSAVPYEPYGQYKIPISSANTTTNIYLGEVETMRRIGKLVLTGEETDWLKASSTYPGCFYKSTSLSAVQTQMYCTHLPYIAVSGFEPGAITISESKQINLWFEQFDNNTTVADFKTYLQQQYANGIPITVWYVLATPETAVVNEPLRKIGDYADTLSYEQAGVQIPTNKGNTVIDVDTTLKPSQMYIKYQE